MSSGESFEEVEESEEKNQKFEEVRRLEALIQNETVCMTEVDKSCLVSICEEAPLSSFILQTRHGQAPG